MSPVVRWEGTVRGGKEATPRGAVAAGGMGMAGEEVQEPAEDVPCPCEEDDPDDDEGAVGGGDGYIDAGAEDGMLCIGIGGAYENAIRDAMRAERRLCASFSLARFTRETTLRIASPALRTASSTAACGTLEASRRFGRSWSSSNGYLHIRWTGLIK